MWLKRLRVEYIYKLAARLKNHNHQYIWNILINMTTRETTRIPRKSNLPKVSGVDLFCGVGGLTHGLKKSGITVRAGIDLDKSCKYAYEVNNNAKFIGADISKVTGEQIKKL